MSYLVLARKWRPKNFSELVGQEHVVRALENGLASGRIHHAFLFTGTRGVGKTTIARIIAKALNCQTGVTATPCGVCSACSEIDQGRFVDLLEIDAASRTKVDDTRELLDNVVYAPARGRYKVYLIDEVHMLSTHSFNALLKTLEEPPPHVKFVLATTDPQKLPVTVLSRCLKFHLKRLTIAQIGGQLRHILAAEGIGFEAEALDELARAADGSMRDSLSLLDQAIGYGGGRVDAVVTREMLGAVARDSLLDLLLAIAAGDRAATWQQLERIVEHNPSYATVLAQLLELLHDAALQQVFGTEAALLELPPKVATLAAALPPGELQLLYQIALLGSRDLGLAPDPRVAFEMAVLRMLAFAPSYEPSYPPQSNGPNSPSRKPPLPSAAPRSSPPTSASTAPAAAPAAQPTIRAPAAPPTVAAPLQAPPPAPAVARPLPWEDAPAPVAAAPVPVPRPAAAAPAPAAPPAPVAVESPDLDRYEALVGELTLSAPAAELARQLSVRSCTDTTLALLLPPDWAFMLSDSLRGQFVERLQAARPQLARIDIEIGAPVSATLAERQARRLAAERERFVGRLQEEPLVQALVREFDARIVPESVRMGAAGA